MREVRKAKFGAAVTDAVADTNFTKRERCDEVERKQVRSPARLAGNIIQISCFTISHELVSML